METATTEIVCNNRNIIVGSMYRPPNTDHKEFLKCYTEYLVRIKKENEDIILGMDHNLDFLKIELHKPTAMFISLNIGNDLISCITRPTQITKTSATLIDNMFINSKYQEGFKSDILLENMSDNLPCRTIIPDGFIRKKVSRQVTSRNTHGTKIIALKEALENETW